MVIYDMKKGSNRTLEDGRNNIRILHCEKVFAKLNVSLEHTI